MAKKSSLFFLLIVFTSHTLYNTELSITHRASYSEEMRRKACQEALIGLPLFCCALCCFYAGVMAALIAVIKTSQK